MFTKKTNEEITIVFKFFGFPKRFYLRWMYVRLIFSVIFRIYNFLYSYCGFFEGIVECFEISTQSVAFSLVRFM